MKGYLRDLFILVMMDILDTGYWILVTTPDFGWDKRIPG
jgi:hypothetical protein